MKFNFNVDKQNNILTFTITLPDRKSVKIPKRKIGFRKMKELLDKNIDLPPGYLLGECKNSHMAVSNSPDTPDSVAWKFDLIPPAVKKEPAKKQQKQKSSPKVSKPRTRRKKTELT
jgi:hypothetical protein